MHKRHHFYTWVSGAINIKDYTETVTLAITRAQIVSCSDLFGPAVLVLLFPVSHFQSTPGEL